MRSDECSPIREEDVQGLKYFRQLWPLFERLHELGCERDKAEQPATANGPVLRVGAAVSCSSRASVRCGHSNRLRSFRTCSESWAAAERRWCHSPKRPTCSIRSGSARSSENSPPRCSREDSLWPERSSSRKFLAGRRRQCGSNALDDCRGGVFEEPFTAKASRLGGSIPTSTSSGVSRLELTSPLGPQ